MNKTPQNRVLIAFCATILAFTVSSAQANEGAAKKVEGPIYVDFKNIVVPVIKKNGSTGVIALSIMAEVKDADTQTMVTSQMPKLRDAFIRVLYGSMESNQIVRTDGALDIEHIKQRLIKSAGYVMKDKDNPIQDILFQNIAQQTY